MNKIVLASALVFAALTTGVSAQNYRHGSNTQAEIDTRQHNQEQRIRDGLRSGDLTRREAAQLEAEQARIRELERRAQRDGRIDRQEADQIRRAQNEASRHIYQERHDGERRGSGYGWWYRRWW